MKTPLLTVRLVQFFGLLLLLFCFFLIATYFQAETTIRDRAFLGMTIGLTLLWIVLFGLFTWLFRNAVRERVRAIPIRWEVKFVLFCTLLALLEEAITTTMTNLAPVFGVKMGEAYITASANYLDVVLFHSVIVFIPMFIAWVFILKRWDISPAAVFLLYGLQGILAESLSFGFSLIGAGFWIYVYGLMVYLPVYSIPRERGAQLTRWYHYPLVVVSPFLGSIPVAILIMSIHSTSIHF